MLLSAAYCLLPTVCCLLSAAYCLLPTVCYLLLSACYQLSTTSYLLAAVFVCCLLPAFFCLLPADCYLLSSPCYLVSTVYRVSFMATLVFLCLSKAISLISLGLKFPLRRTSDRFLAQSPRKKLDQ